MQRRDFIKTAGGLILLAGAPPWTRVLAETTPTGNGGRPMNILFITADDMNGSMPGWMGHPLKLTPNMDAFVQYPLSAHPAIGTPRPFANLRARR